MPQVRKLRIVKNIRDVSMTGYHRVLLVKLLLLAAPLFVYVYQEKVERSSLYSGHENQKRQHDIEKWSKEPSYQYQSSWRAKEPYITDSQYKASIFDGLSWIFLTFFNLRGTLEVMKSLLKHMFSFCVYVAQVLVRRYGIRNLILYLLFCTMWGLLLTFGNYEIVLTLARLTLERIIKWMEESIIIFDATDETNKSTPFLPPLRQVHPWTMGNGPPYFLYTFYGYNNEDVVFQCEYLVLSLEDARHIYRTSGWRKHGVPVLPNEKIHVDINIRVLEDWEVKDIKMSPPGRFFSVVTTLTIVLIDDNDYGAYTCDYYSPAIFVYPGPKMSEGYTKESKRDSSAPDPTCGCKPCPPPPRPKCENNERPRTSTTQQCNQERAIPPELFQCFAQFLLRKVPDRTTQLAVNPGSILIYRAPYVTVANESDLEYNVTSFSRDSMEHNCCSKFVKMYWLLTRSVIFHEFPYSRLVHTIYGFYLERGQCLCKSSFGTTVISLRRWFYNESTGISELVDISHPSKLQLIPHITHPFSGTNDSTARNTFYSTECLDSDLSSAICATQDYWLEKAIDILVQYETILFYVSMSSFCFLVFLVTYITRSYCILPFTTACLNYGRPRIPFDTVEGPPLGTLKPCQNETDVNNDRFGENEENEEEGNLCEGNNYDVFLSYDDEEPYDLKVAQFLKKRLQEINRSVFDVMTDIPYGRCLLTETAKAIQRSSRFVVIASKGYIETKVLEFDVIQSTIVSQYSKPKCRLLIISVEDCEIVGLQRVPCIHLPKGLKDRGVMDQDSEIKFELWERHTRPQSKDEIQHTDKSCDSPESSSDLSIKDNILQWAIFVIYWYFTFKLLAANTFSWILGYRNDLSLNLTQKENVAV